jgi:cell division protein FtsB
MIIITQMIAQPMRKCFLNFGSKIICFYYGIVYRNMLEYQRKQKVRNILYSKASIIVLAILLVMCAKGAWGMYGKMVASAEAKENASRELHNITQRKTNVGDEISRLKTKEGLETEIRGKFNVAMPGEEVIILIKGEEAPQQVQEEGFFESIFNRTKAFFTGE